MKTTRALAQAGQSLWLDNITRTMLDNGTLARYIAELDVTGLTSNPTIYEKAIGGSDAYAAQIAAGAKAGRTNEQIFFELAVDDLSRAADLFRPIHERTQGGDGYVSLEVSPLLAYDAAATADQALALHATAGRPNLLIKIPGTAEGLPAIERAIFEGVPVNVTLLFSSAHVLASAEAYTRGIERRLEAGRSVDVRSVASLFISRWDPYASPSLPPGLKGALGLAIGRQAFNDHTAFFSSERWQRLRAAGARPQTLLFASTGTKDPAAPPTFYVAALGAADTIDTIPEETLLATGAAELPVVPLVADGVDHLAPFRAAGFDLDGSAAELQSKGAASFVGSWSSLLAKIDAAMAAG